MKNVCKWGVDLNNVTINNVLREYVFNGDGFCISTIGTAREHLKGKHISLCYISIYGGWKPIKSGFYYKDILELHKDACPILKPYKRVVIKQIEKSYHSNRRWKMTLEK